MKVRNGFIYESDEGRWLNLYMMHSIFANHLGKIVGTYDDASSDFEILAEYGDPKKAELAVDMLFEMDWQQGSNESDKRTIGGDELEVASRPEGMFVDPPIGHLTGGNRPMIDGAYE